MKKMLLAALLGGAALNLGAQDAPAAAPAAPAKPRYSALILPNIFAIPFGYFAGTFEFALSEKLALFMEPSYWNIRNVAFSDLWGQAIPQDFQFWLGSLKIGPTFYFSQMFKGFYATPYVKGSYFVLGDNSYKVEAGSAGAGIQGGYRWTWGWFSMSMGGSYEYNRAFASLESAQEDIGQNFFLSGVNGGMPGFFLSFAIAVE